jgi:hypothetical protein
MSRLKLAGNREVVRVIPLLVESAGQAMVDPVDMEARPLASVRRASGSGNRPERARPVVRLAREELSPVGWA